MVMVFVGLCLQAMEAMHRLLKKDLLPFESILVGTSGTNVGTQEVGIENLRSHDLLFLSSRAWTPKHINVKWYINEGSTARQYA